MDIFGGVKKSGDVLKALITVFGVMLFTAVVFYLLMGTFVQQAADGNLPIDGAYNASTPSASTGTIGDIVNTQENFSSVVGTLSSNAITVVSFVILGIIILIASVFLGKKLGAGRKDNDF